MAVEEVPAVASGSPRYNGIMDNSTSVIVSDPAVMSGTPVFRGTRVPVRTLFDYLAAGDSLDVFLDGFPSVTKAAALAAIREAADAVMVGHGAHLP